MEPETLVKQGMKWDNSNFWMEAIAGGVQGTVFQQQAGFGLVVPGIRSCYVTVTNLMTACRLDVARPGPRNKKGLAWNYHGAYSGGSN